jgi:hypothetical protein
MRRLAQWHAPDLLVLLNYFILSCRQTPHTQDRFRSGPTDTPALPDHNHHAWWSSIASQPALKTHSLRLSARTRQRLTSHDFIESARRSNPTFHSGYIPPGTSDKDLA